MTDLENEGAGPEPGHEAWTSTTYSSNITCGICGAPVRNIPVMYEAMNIDWRCVKCLRRDRPVLEEHPR